MSDDPIFRADLYRGTAEAYDRFRLGYPTALFDDLMARAGVTSTGRLMDLACGTGQITFALQDRFAEVWAVDQEPDMVAMVDTQAAAAGLAHIRSVVAAAETLDAPAASFDVIAIGNAFHRLDRRTVAANVLGWLAPNGHLAQLWSDPPWTGDAPWQQAMATTLDDWRSRVDDDRIPPGWQEARDRTPDEVILAEAGFELLGRHSFLDDHEWTTDDLVGIVRSTSFLPLAALGTHAAGFEADLRSALIDATYGADRFRQSIEFAYVLARRP